MLDSMELNMGLMFVNIILLLIGWEQVKIKFQETVNQPFSAFPFNDFNLLPTVSFVVPNQSNNMHDGTDPERITNSDNWIKNNLDGFIQWVKNNNSLLILTFDEDNYESSNHILTIFTGKIVKGGSYSETHNLYSILRTIEDMYELPNISNAATQLKYLIAGKKYQV